MRSLSQKLILVLLLSFSAIAQSPHGENFDVDCSQCHSATDWKVLPNSVQFDHSTTKFPLLGQHQTLSCRNCHATLKFTANKSDCISCHTDLHQGTVGKDCSKCHTPKSWMVEDINGLHQKSRFPLVGTHLIADCQQCHPRYVDLYFEPLNIDCYTCHASEYNSTQNPNHASAGFPKEDCQDCHDITASSWSVVNVNHNFFPLVGGHAISNCFQCHEQGGNFTSLSPACITCHEDDYIATQNPNHAAAGFPTDCEQCHTIEAWQPAAFDHNVTEFPLTGSHLNTDCNSCHEQGYTNTPMDCYSCHQPEYMATTNPNHIAAQFSTTCQDCHTTNGWTPATFDHDGLYFPIYTGKHAGEWNMCADCHQVSNNYSMFTCISCHEHNQQDMDDDHDEVQGYIYESGACFSCHPTGEKGNAFNHNNTAFPLTGVHTTINCQQCHQTGYQGTPMECVACHQVHYNNTTNPSHSQLGLSTDCTTCHSTDPNWKPALFPVHNQYFELLGRHMEIANDCATCHNGNYTTTSNLCFSCHANPYNDAQNPNHLAAGIPTECEQCHSSNAWIPSTFNHTLVGFELIGSHSNIQCSNCHEGIITGLNSECISCHQDDFNLAPDHIAQGYPSNCEMCHNSIAWNQVNFNHNSTNFPLTGAHIGTTCADCHESGFTGTTTICYDCHQQNYNQSSNPSHTVLSLPTDCVQCHTTNPDWQPATFTIHNQFFQLIGAHANINNCGDCHNGNYVNTPNTCIGCHQNDYNVTSDPPHQILNFSFDCLQCHSMNGWTPANFNHSFYPISNDHNNVDCNQCHSQANYQPQCLSCHFEDFLDEHDPGDPTNCWDCHTTFDWDIDSPGMERTNELN